MVPGPTRDPALAPSGQPAPPIVIAASGPACYAHTMRMMLPLCLLLAAPAVADPPAIEAANASRTGDSWRFSVTLSHPDTGWDHYADGWRVELADGTVLGTRVLLHPHVNEQPFTRSQSGIAIPEATARVLIRARCLVDGWADEALVYTLP